MGIDGSWVLTSLVVGGGGVDLAGVTVTLDATDDHISGRGGVNRYMGAVPTGGGTITFGPLATTLMAGPPAAMEVERTYLQALQGTFSVERTTTDLVLRRDDTMLGYQARDPGEAWLDAHPMWQFDDGALVSERTFADFAEAISFVNRVADAAEAAGHHPDLAISWNRVTIRLTTHDAGSTVTDRDRSLAEVVDRL